MPSVPVMCTADGRFVTDLNVDGIISSGWDWSSWDEVTVNANANTVDLDVIDGKGVITGVPPAPNVNDRRLFLLDGFTAIDVEVRCIYENVPPVTGAGGQGGVVARVQPGGNGTLAPLGWNNIFFGADGGILPGVWDFDGVNGVTIPPNSTNQQTPNLVGYRRLLEQASGDGVTITFDAAEPHKLMTNSAITIINALVGQGTPTPGQQDYLGGLTIIDVDTFSVSDTEVGTQPGGSFHWQFWPDEWPRALAIRLIGNTMLMKQWPVGLAPEPTWDDPVKTNTIVFPDTLDNGVPFPTTPGRVGFVTAHLGQAGQIIVHDFQAWPLS